MRPSLSAATDLVPLKAALGLASLAMGLALLLAPQPVMADTLAPIPPLTRHVVDQASLLQPAQAEELDQRLARFEKTHGSQIAVLIVTTTQPEAIEQYSIRVFDAWKLGRRQFNDGILILVATQDRKLRIDTGYGLEGAIPDAIAKRVVSEVIAPQFRGGNPLDGLLGGVEQIEKLILGEKLPPASQRSGKAGNGGQGQFAELLVIGIVAATIVGGVLSLILGRFFGSLATGGVVGFLAWLMVGSLFAAIGATVLVFIYVLATGGRGGIGLGGWGGGGRFPTGGGWGGGSSSGGSWGGGGGGSAGGGGASGQW